MTEVPDRLRMAGRGLDPEFADEERLFRRLASRADHIAGDTVLPGAIRSPASLSVNREKYSLPEDVVLDHPLHGIFYFRVGDVPAVLAEEEREYTFRVEHAPLEDNYSHSEVRGYFESEPVEALPRVVTTLLRNALCARAQVIKYPPGLMTE